MKRKGADQQPLRSLADLRSVRLARAQPAPVRAARPAQARTQSSAEFRDAVRDVTPLARPRPVPIAPGASPIPSQRERDNRAVLDESLAEQIDVETLLETDAALSYRALGIGPDTLRRLRRGFWVVQDELDLHGHRVAEANQALGVFLKEAQQRGVRCVRIVHGKGNGSRDGVPVLKGKVRLWLTRRSEVIAFCQARAVDGGAGALLVLLKP